MRTFAFVFSSIVGSGAFMLPMNLYRFGNFGFIYLIGTAVIFIYFAYICSNLGPKYLELCRKHSPWISKIIFMTYWIISWISTIAILNEVTAYLVVLGIPNNLLLLKGIQCFLVIGFTLLNSRSQEQSNYTEYIITTLKLLILTVVPLILLYSTTNSTVTNIVRYKPSIGTITNGILLSSFSFLGAEIGTSISTKERDRYSLIAAIMTATGLYLLNVYAIFKTGALAQDIASYALAMDGYFSAFGGKFLVAILIIIVGIGSLNSWIWCPAYMAYDGAKNRLMGAIFAKTNSKGIPINSLWISSIGLLITILCIGGYSSSGFFDILLGKCAVIFFIFYGWLCYVHSRIKKSKGSLILAIVFFTLSVLGLIF